ncbi:hypothetical protein D3C80_1739820 [compost metagenome]
MEGFDYDRRLSTLIGTKRLPGLKLQRLANDRQLDQMVTTKKLPGLVLQQRP